MAVVIWGGVYMARTLGRSDEHHLVSALPPACLVLAHLLSVAIGRWRSVQADRTPEPRLAAWASCSISLVFWIVLQGSDLYLDVEERGIHPLRSLDETVSIREFNRGKRLDHSVVQIANLARPGERILDLTFSPLIYVLADRLGPGYADVVTPGVFADAEHERAFVERLKQDPPTLVLWPKKPFDGMETRALEIHAPQLSKWVHANYQRSDDSHRTREFIMVRRR